MSSSVVVFRESGTSSGLGFSIWMNKMNGMESNVSVKVDGKTLVQGKVEQGVTKKKLCLCAPTSHPGSFKCRYHRAELARNAKLTQDPAAVAKHLLKLGIKSAKPTITGVKSQPCSSRFSKAASATELSR